MKTLVLFDFDHTLYKKDSLLEVTKFIAGHTKFSIGMAALMPYLIGMKLGLIKNQVVKERYLSHFFKDADYTLFTEKAKQFALTRIEKDLDEVLEQVLAKHISQGDEVYIVTASFTEWLKPWCDTKGIQLIASQLEIAHNKITGTIKGCNCYGQEKVNRITQHINTSIYHSIYVYGKGKGDREMLTLKRNCE